MTLFDLPGTLYLEYVINMGLTYSPKLELHFLIYVIIGLITTLIVETLFARVVLKMKPQFTFSYAVRSTLLNAPHFLAKYQQSLALM